MNRISTQNVIPWLIKKIPLREIKQIINLKTNYHVLIMTGKKT